MSKILVAYFSCSGTTKRLAEKIAELSQADLYRIETANPYPNGYRQLVEAALSELRLKARPTLKHPEINLNYYDKIIVGYPNWCGTCPMPVFSFLEMTDLTGKVIAPFCTHGGSRMGESERDLKKSCPGSRLMKGYSDDVFETDKLNNWVKSIVEA